MSYEHLSASIIRELLWNRAAVNMFKGRPNQALLTRVFVDEIDRIEDILRARLKLLNNAYRKGDYEGFVDIVGEIESIEKALEGSKGNE